MMRAFPDNMGTRVWLTAGVLLVGGSIGLLAREPIPGKAPARGTAPEQIDEADVEPAEEAPGDFEAVMVVSETEPWNDPARFAFDDDETSEDQNGRVQVAPKPLGPAADGTLSVLVHLDRNLDVAAVAGGVSPVRASLRQWVAQRRARIQYEYEILPNVVNVRGVLPADVAALRWLPGVLRVEDDYEVHTYHNDSMPLIRAYQTQLQAAGFSGVDGTGIRCCVIDTGIDSNSIMYSTRIDAAAGWDFVNNDPNPEDDNGHGSHCAGTVLGGANVTADFACAATGPENMQGVAPAATLIGVKVLAANGSGSFSNVIAGINRCASTTLPGGQADVISLSLGGGQFTGTCDTDTAAIAVNNAVAAGVVVVAAAGNNGFTNAVGTPACASGAITIAATYDENYPNCDFPSQTSFSFCLNSFCTLTCTDNNPVADQRCCFSNRSTKIDVAAPGCITFSDDYAVPAGNGLIGFCGTSQATPHVAGLAALLLDANPSLTPSQVRTHIRNGAIDKGTAGFDTSYGYGRIDVINSLNLAAPPGCTSDPQCSDGLFCNGAEVCNAGTCQAGTPPNCADSVACTTDTCNEGTDSCDHTPNHGACSDGLFCNGSEVCNVTLGCQAGTPPNCADSVACTVDSCNESTDSCDHVANNGLCDDGFFCNGAEVCHVTLGCQAGSDPCPGQSCDEGGDVCVECVIDADCDDGLFCNGGETCNAGTCVAGTAPNCADSVACTTDSCNESTDFCDHTPNHGACSDGLFCNGSEVCNVTLGCQAGTPPNCADSVACTDDSCNEATDSCDHVANNGLCDDGLFCNGGETCHVTLGCQAGSDPCPGQSCDEGGDVCVECVIDADCDDGLFCNGGETCNAGTCQSGTAPNCNDGVACTDDSCNESTDSCDHAANNGLCDDGLFCNGVETCNVTLGCQAGSDPCGGQPCIEATDTCGGRNIWMAFTTATTVPGLGSVANEDIVAYNTASGTWSWVFDGSDVGLSSLVIDGVARLASGDILLSFTVSASIPGMTGGPSGTTADDSDIVRFVPTSLGSTTAGSFVFYFDGSDVGLTTDAEDVDAISLTSGGSLVVSTEGAFSVTGLSGQDEDLLTFNATSLGSVTSGSFQMYFDGSDVGLSTTADEDVDAAGLTPGGKILLSTFGPFSVPGVSGSDEDVVEFTPTSTGSVTAGSYIMLLDLSAIGIDPTEDVTAVEEVP